MRVVHVILLLMIAAASCVASEVSFTFEAADQGAVTGLGVLSVFHTTVRNTGTAPDTYRVVVTRGMPEAWSCSLCEGGVCYPPFVPEISFGLAAGAETILDIDLAPLATEGSGVARVTVTSQGDTAHTTSLDFQVVTGGVQVLLVDGDGGQALEDYFSPAFGASSASWARWPRDFAGALTATELSGFAGVAWFAAGMAPALTDADRAALAYYVQHGGSLLLCGQDVVEQSCDPSGPWYSPGAASWFQVVCGATYAGPATGAASVAGLPASPFARALAAQLNGAGGAGNSVAPDALAAVGAGVLAQQYGTGAGAAVTATFGAGRSYLCGYAVESLGPATARDAFLAGFLNWARGLPSAVAQQPPAAWIVEPTASPNPFNPTTTISFEAGGPGPLRVDVCDLRGRLVRRLLDRSASDGLMTLAWDGRSDDGLRAPSGVYLARVAAGDQVRTIKMVLAK